MPKEKRIVDKIAWLRKQITEDLIIGKTTLFRKDIVNWLYKNTPNMGDGSIRSMADKLVKAFKQQGLIMTIKPGLYKINKHGT